MGIKFQCPNCGKGLNVKSNLAGRRGLCPHCRGRVQIPAESEVAAPSNVTRGPVPPRDSRSAGAIAPQVFENLAFENLAVEDLDPNSFQLERPQVELATSTASHFDWIADAPEAVWYVRNRAGGQYGPAVGSIMRTWLQEGRVSRDCYVWREGWANWRQANDVFPHLFEPRTHGQPPQLPQTMGSPSQADESRGRVASEPAEAVRGTQAVENSIRQRNSTGLFIAILLLVLTVSSVAIGTLVYFLPRSTPVGPTPGDDDPIQLRDPFEKP